MCQTIVKLDLLIAIFKHRKPSFRGEALSGPAGTCSTFQTLELDLWSNGTEIEVRERAGEWVKEWIWGKDRDITGVNTC